MANPGRRDPAGDGQTMDEVDHVPLTEPPFRISSFCHSGGCVAVAVGAEEISLRSSRESDGPVLSFTREEWTAFVAGVRDGEFDPPAV